IFKLILGLFILSIAMVFLYKWVPVPATPLMVIRFVENFQDDKPIFWKHDWVSIEEISKNLQLAVICSEDQNFLFHNGFDVEAIEKAYQDNKKENALKEPVLLVSRQLKMCFYGLNAVG